jgi:hypothetical protein
MTEDTGPVAFVAFTVIVFIAGAEPATLGVPGVMVTVHNAKLANELPHVVVEDAPLAESNGLN